MEELGMRFKEKRLELGISLEEAEHETKITSCHLKAIEEGDFDKIEREVFLKGFLKVYSSYLGLNKRDILKEYEDNNIEDIVEEDEEDDEVLELKEKVVKYFDDHQNGLMTIILFSLAILATIILLYFGVISYRNRAQKDEAQSNTTPIERLEESIEVMGEDVGEDSSFKGEEKEDIDDDGSALTYDDQLALSEDIEDSKEDREEDSKEDSKEDTKEDIESDRLADEIEIEIKVLDDSWYFVESDGEEVFSGIDRAGGSRFFSGDNIRVRIGNAAGIVIVMDGEEMGPFGGQGEVVNRTFTRD